MPVIPSGMLSIPLECLRALLANCTAWQTWTGEATAAAAKERVHLHDIPPPAVAGGAYEPNELTSRRPLARIDDWQPERGFGEQQWVARRVGERGPYTIEGKLVLDFVDDVLPEDARDPVAVKLRFTNNVGAVVEALLDLAGSSSYLTAGEIAAGVMAIGIQSIEVYQGYCRSDEAAADTQGEHTRMQLLIHWGL